MENNGNSTSKTTNDGASGTTNEEASAFLKSGKLARSPAGTQTATSNSGEGTAKGQQEEKRPVVGQVFTPTSSNGASQGALLLGKIGMIEARKRVNELFDFVKDKSNVHTKIKQLVTGIKVAMTAAEREHKGLKRRAEEAEKALIEAKEDVMSVDDEETPKGHKTPRKKRDRETPGEDEKAKKHKQQEEDSEQREDSEQEEDYGKGWRVASGKKKKDKLKKKENGEPEVEDQKDENPKDKNPKDKTLKDKNLKDKNPKVDKPKVEQPKEEKRKSEPRKKRLKGDALIIEVKEGLTYAELLRKVRTDPKLKELGENVVKARRTQKGEMLFELKKDPAVKSSAFKSLVEQSLGAEATVKALSPETVIECKNLDEITTACELEDALRALLGDLQDVQMVVRMRKAYGNTQNASIRLSTPAANKLLAAGKVKVWWSVCSLRMAPRVSQQMTRCFKCLGFGHLARNCEGPDRSKLCWKCGESEHVASDCKKQPKCMLCKEQDGNDHVTGGLKCPAYKQAAALQK